MKKGILQKEMRGMPSCSNLITIAAIVKNIFDLHNKAQT